VDNDDRGLGAMPKLVGGPRYTRPPLGLPPAERPVDPDDLPLENERTPEDHALVVDAGFAPAPAGDAPVASSGNASSAAYVPAPGPDAAPREVEYLSGAWTASGGVAAPAGSRSLRRSFGSLFRTRSGGSTGLG
jgi:hypothetical protein